MTASPKAPTVDTSLGALTARESELLQRAGDRIFALSKKLADSDRANQRLEQDLRHSGEILHETRQTRDILANQVQSLQAELEREYVERSELRRLLASLQMQLQTMLTPAPKTQVEPTGMAMARAAPQRASATEPTRANSNGWLRSAVREIRRSRSR